MVCRHMPPPPGVHWLRVGWLVSDATSSQDFAPVAAAEQCTGIRSRIHYARLIRRAGAHVPGPFDGLIWNALQIQAFFRELPCFPAITAGMDVRPEPGAVHRRVEPLRLARILRDMIHFLPAKVRTVGAPGFAITVENAKAPLRVPIHRVSVLGIFNPF